MNRPEQFTMCASGDANTLELTGADWISLVRLAHDVEGPAAARALWQASPLPKPPDRPMIVAMFADECIQQKAGARVRASDLHALYTLWCESKNYDPLGPSGFGRAMTKLGYERIKVSVLHYKNVKISSIGARARK